MEAKERAIAYIKQTQKLTIPFFQRAYVWDETNWEELLDTFQKIREGQFLGSLLFRPIPKTGSPSNSFVIDGQQRLTTISILIKALYDSLSPELEAKFKNFVREFLFYKINTSDDNFIVKIEHSYLDRTPFEEIVKYKLDSDKTPFRPKTDEEKKANKILACYYYFLDIFVTKDDIYKKSLFDDLSSNNYNVLVFIDLSPTDNEQKIFDTINSAGIKLGCADIVKNSLFQIAYDLLRKENNNNAEEALKALYKSTWEKTFLFNDSEDKETDEYWQKDRTMGRVYKNTLEILLYCYAQIKGMFDPAKDKISDLANIYKSKIQSFQTVRQIEEFVKSICKYAGKYREMIPIIDVTDTFSFENSRLRLFQLLEKIDISVFEPYILQLIINYENNEEQLNCKLRELEIYIMRRYIAGESAKNYNKICFELLQNKTALTSKISEIPDSVIVDKLKYIENKKATLLLFWIELSRRDKNKNLLDITELSYTYTLEHVMPQAWYEHWHYIPKKIRADGQEMTSKEASEDRSMKIYWLGNMTLIKGQLNTRLRNYTFEDKIEGKGKLKNKGIHACTELLISKEDLVTPYWQGEKIWDENRIERRTDFLAKEILKIWPSML